MTFRSGIICAGNWIVDHVYEVDEWPREGNLARINKRSISVGGGAANVSSVLSNLKTGLNISPMGAVGRDANGQLVVSHCKDRDLPTHLIATKPFASTARTHVVSVRGQSRTHFYEGGASDELNAEDFSEAALELASARVFYMGYLTLLKSLDSINEDGSSVGCTVLARAKALGMTTCVDLASANRPDYAEIVAAALPSVDYLIINHREASLATGIPLADTSTPDEIYEAMASRLLGGGVQAAAVIHSPEKTLWAGKNGAIFWQRSELLPKSKIISPLGAGDAFCAALLYAIHEGWETERAMQLAEMVARASLLGTNASRSVPELSALLPKLHPPQLLAS